MVPASNKQSVLIFGGTGKTGSSVVDGLVDSQNFDVSAMVRPSSTDKPSVESMRSRGVTIHPFDLATVTSNSKSAAFMNLVSILKGFDTVIALVPHDQLQLQLPLIDACKEAGVKRFVPCDAGTACVKGVMDLHDQKLVIHEYIQKVGIGYTYIDVGYWSQLALPVLDTDPSKLVIPYFPPLSFDFVVPSDPASVKKSAFTDLRDIGHFFSRIIADERTMNKYVFCWADEKSQSEIWEIVEKVVGKEVKKVEISEQTALATRYAADMHVYTQYRYSMWVRGDNTVQNAKKPEYGGAQDARELYPDFHPKTLEDYAKEMYGTSN